MLSRKNVIKDTHKENAPSSKTQALTKSMNIDIWVVATSNEKYEYRHWGGWYIKLIIYQRFLHYNKIFKKAK